MRTTPRARARVDRDSLPCGASVHLGRLVAWVMASEGVEGRFRASGGFGARRGSGRSVAYIRQ